MMSKTDKVAASMPPVAAAEIVNANETAVTSIL